MKDMQYHLLHFKKSAPDKMISLGFFEMLLLFISLFQNFVAYKKTATIS